MHAVIDVETGGFSKQKNGLCEVAVIIIDQNYKELERFSSSIRPYFRPDSDELVSYKPDAMAVNGIKLEDLEDAPEAQEVAENIEYLLTKHNVNSIIAHNAKSMDKPWVEYFLARFGTGFKFDEVICTLQLARDKKLPLPDNRLETLCSHFGIKNTDEHRALSDAQVTLELLICLNNVIK